MSTRTLWLHTPSGPRGPFTLPELVEAAKERRHKQEPRHRPYATQDAAQALADAPALLDLLDSLWTYGPCTQRFLREDTGRGVAAVRQLLYKLRELGYARRWLLGVPLPAVWAVTTLGREALALAQQLRSEAA